MKRHFSGARMFRIVILVAVAVLLALLSKPAGFAQSAGRSEDRSGPLHGNSPIKPFKIIGNVYYVGLSDQTSYLITTPQGHFLIDATWEGGVPEIRKSIEQLGFKVKDVKYLLNAHAHSDHVAGLSGMKELTGAKVLAMADDVPTIQDGGASDSKDGKPQWPPVRVDQALHDGEQLKLGGVTMVAHLTPGHTKGCTSWSMVADENGKKYNVVFICSMRVNPRVALVHNKKYPNIAEDYEKGFNVLKGLPCDIFLASHGNQFGMTERIKRMEQNPGVNPFIDPEGYRNYIATYERAFQDELKKQGGSLPR